MTEYNVPTPRASRQMAAPIRSGASPGHLRIERRPEVSRAASEFRVFSDVPKRLDSLIKRGWKALLMQAVCAPRSASVPWLRIYRAVLTGKAALRSVALLQTGFTLA